MRGLALFVASGGGLGYAPIASGTWGTLPAFPLFLIATAIGGFPAAIVGATVVTALGWVSTAAALPALGREDPGEVVIDEIAGQWLTLLFVPAEPVWWIAAFVAFRIADIVKIPPADRLERLHGATGVMSDDLAAGLWAGVVLFVIRAFV